MATFVAATAIDFDALDLAGLALAPLLAGDTGLAILVAGDVTVRLSGSAFQYASAGPPNAGTIAGVSVSVGGATTYDIAGLAIPAATFRGWVLAGDNASAKAGLFAAADAFTGSLLADRLRGYAGDDTMTGADGDDILDGGDGDDDVFGGPGADTVTDPGGSNYLRGDEGADQLVGGADFDDINGNMGNDTASGGPGGDWVVGGKDNDLLFGDDGGDIVYGNLGDDVIHGDAGVDIVRGGQGADSLTGGPGDDYVSGDRGDDTMTGGSGADLFHSSSDAGIDRVLDFSIAEGDRVMLDPGTTYTVMQVGGDTVIQLAAGQVVLVGVSMSSLTAASIFLG